ncbi:MAG: hypothetical protein ACK4EX_04710 [Thermaurantimonas sp.]|uniref:hypothetical protein n=1 Tax=Thermaurantimonas sp. TaxID=2681568 RepID=UPI00391A1BC6
MAKEAKQVLDELCAAILKSAKDDLPQLVEWSRELYEQLVIMHYLYQQHAVNETKTDVASDKILSVKTYDTHETKVEDKKTPENTPTEIVHQQADIRIEKPVKEKVEKTFVQEKTEKSVIEKKLYVDTENVGRAVYTEIKQEKVEVSITDGGLALNERLATSSKIALGLNDKIAFSRHLFNGDDAAMSALIDAMNGAQTFEQAMNYLHQARAQFGHWDEKKEFVTRLENLVRRKFGKPEIIED